eukprot:TRINITY_DN100651_c0_g1_i1.p1 TRINITY_DN100651_c0_g1~~TRINITY_DN100651_c0_g1_i1.p1  ORF type:complete len:704 (-),score=148.31 TRINITY_DN100651_c0_g1_i1:219-2330(-)
MRPLFRPDACVVNEAGLQTSGNALSRALDVATGDAMGVHQMREGYLANGRPMGPMMGPGGQMLRPMMKGGSSMDAAWHDAGPMPGAPVLGDAMPQQLMRHMDALGVEHPAAHGPGFFAGVRQMPSAGSSLEAEWSREMGAGPAGPQMMGPRPMGPSGDQWAAEMQRHGNMEAMDLAFAQSRQMPGQSSMGPMAAGPGMMGMMMPSMMMPMMHRPQMQQPTMQYQPAAPVMKAAEVKAEVADLQEVQEEPDLAQAAKMVHMLRNSGNPKFADSQFVNFIDKVSKGDLRFQENSVIDRDGHTVDWDALYDMEADEAHAERTQLDKMWKDAAGEDQSLDEVWRTIAKESGMDDLLGDESEAALMEKFWRDDEMGMQDIWSNVRPAEKQYQFQENNPYLSEESPLALALRLIREGRDREALLALEAEVTRNPESSEGWRIMGQLYAEMDQDVEAIQCLRKGHEVDPYNLDSLLALGVSCTNELDQLPALRYLRQWIENHEEHSLLVQGLDPPAQYEYEAWRKQVTDLFNQAAEANPMDADVAVALGVLGNLNRDYDAATKALANACRLRPNDHTCWNKLGATLANSGRSEQAVIAYHQGLLLKPNYARSWSNLAIAHANLHQHADAARFYLSSLALNPEATHIWSFLHSAVLNMNDLKGDVFSALDSRDINGMKEFVDGVLDPATLPAPAPSLPQPADEILRSLDLA